MALKDILNSNVEQAQQDAATQRQNEYEKKQKELKAQYQRGVSNAQNAIPEITQKMKEASQKGLRSYTQDVYQWSREYGLDEYDRGYTSTLIEHFKTEDIKGSLRHSEMEPCGSDPLFDYTVYSLYIEFTW
jgi:hypothetical protein